MYLWLIYFQHRLCLVLSLTKILQWMETEWRAGWTKGFSSTGACVCVCVQSCLILCDPMKCSPPGSCPWDFPCKNTGVGCHFLLQRIIPTQGSNPRLLRLLHWQADSLPLGCLRSPVQVPRNKWFASFADLSFLGRGCGGGSGGVWWGWGGTGKGTRQGDFLGGWSLWGLNLLKGLGSPSPALTCSTFACTDHAFLGGVC